jgi:hypothetical protein
MALSLKTYRDDRAGEIASLHPTKEVDAMAQTCIPSIDSVICHEVTSLVSCTLDDLLQRLPAYSWAQVFAAVDRLSRKGTLMLRRTSRFGYVLSVGSDPPVPSLRNSSGVRHSVGGMVESTLVET